MGWSPHGISPAHHTNGSLGDLAQVIPDRVYEAPDRVGQEVNRNEPSVGVAFVPSEAGLALLVQPGSCRLGRPGGQCAFGDELEVGEYIWRWLSLQASRAHRLAQVSQEVVLWQGESQRHGLGLGCHDDVEPGRVAQVERAEVRTGSNHMSAGSFLLEALPGEQGVDHSDDRLAVGVGQLLDLAELAPESSVTRLHGLFLWLLTKENLEANTQGFSELWEQVSWWPSTLSLVVSDDSLRDAEDSPSWVWV